MVVERQTGLKVKNSPHTTVITSMRINGEVLCIKVHSHLEVKGNNTKNAQDDAGTLCRSTSLKATYLKQKICLSTTIDNQSRKDKRKQAEGRHCGEMKEVGR
jgi:hypothetical protein